MSQEVVQGNPKICRIMQILQNGFLHPLSKTSISCLHKESIFFVISQKNVVVPELLEQAHRAMQNFLTTQMIVCGTHFVYSFREWMLVIFPSFAIALIHCNSLW